MDGFANILHHDFGLKPQGKSAPMAPPSSAKASPGFGAGAAASGSSRSSRSSTPIMGDSRPDDPVFGGNGFKTSSTRTFGSGAADVLGGGSAPYDDVFGGPSNFSASSYSGPMQNYDLIFGMPAESSAASSKVFSLPVFDAPVYDDDIFGGVRGVRSTGVVYDDVFSGSSGAGANSSAFDDLLGGFGAAVPKANETPLTNSQRSSAFDSMGSVDSTYGELLPGFGGTEPSKPRSSGDLKPSRGTSSGSANNSSRKAVDDPFVNLDHEPVISSPAAVPSFSDLDPFSVASELPQTSGKQGISNGLAEGIAGFDNISPSVPVAAVPSTKSANRVRYAPQGSDTGSPIRNAGNKESSEAKPQKRSHSSHNSLKQQTKSPKDNAKDELDGSTNSHESGFASLRNHHFDHEATAPVTNHSTKESVQLPKVERSANVDEFWITVDEVKLATRPSAAPPPSRPPPVPGLKSAYATRKPVDVKQEGAKDTRGNFNDFLGHQQAAGGSWQPPCPDADSTSKVTTNHSSSIIDELEVFASGVARARKETSLLEEEEEEESVAAAAAASAAAMKEAMERAEARSRLAKEAREREREEREKEAKAIKAREERERAREVRERDAREAREREAHEAREREAREKEEKERAAREVLEIEEREREEREMRERRRKEKEREREREREREKDRIAVERATQEARERAAAEAKEKAERAAVERVTAEARERAAVEAKERAAADARARAERAAVERANAEARERAAERAATERAAAEARERAEKAAVERANAEARERAAERAAAARAAAEARERAEKAAAERAAAARGQQRRNENDLESFFMSASRANSAPRQRPADMDMSSDAHAANKAFASEVQRRSSTGAASVRKVASTTNIADDLTSLFGVGGTGDEFQEQSGESAERRRARLERHQRTRERAARALEEKNNRDLQSQRDQAERHRAAEMLDAEIKRWAAGKEGNLRALLSTLQYVLWPECGWQPVSLTDLITAAAVKKVYRKATLCVHPDKVQQKGASIQQKYIAEKVFDLLKESWNKFNSEELF